MKLGKSDSIWRVAEVDHFSAPAMRDLFREVFKQEMSEQHWLWKYGNNRGRGIGVWDGDRLIAHYGGVTRSLLDAGVPCLGAQGADVAVTPGERGHMMRRGPYFMAASTFHARFMGRHAMHLYGFGFPNERHFRLANLLGLYVAVDRVVEFSFSSSPEQRRSKVNAIGVHHILDDAGLRKDLDDAWQRMRDDLYPLLLGVRDSDYLSWRYARHPLFSYTLLAVNRWSFGWRTSFALVRRVENGLEWLDIVGTRHDIPKLTVAVRRYAGQCGADKVFGWINESQKDWFQKAGAIIRATDVIIPANAWSNAPPAETQRGRWWMMSGDSDAR